MQAWSHVFGVMSHCLMQAFKGYFPGTVKPPFPSVSASRGPPLFLHVGRFQLDVGEQVRLTAHQFAYF